MPTGRASHPGAVAKPCPFCEIAAGRAAAPIAFADPISVAFLDHRPLLRGHLLLVPRAHYETLPALPRDLIDPFFANVQLLARAVEEALSADGSLVAVNTRVSQSVMHLHVHVVPRWRGDGLFSPRIIWRRRPYRSEAEAERVRAAIAGAAERLAATPAP